MAQPATSFSVRLQTGFEMVVSGYQVSAGQVTLLTATGEIRLPESAIAAVEPLDVAPPRREPESAMAPVVGQVAEARPPVPLPGELVRRAAIRQGLPPEFVESVARSESGLRPDAVSHKGAIGLMQLMPGTARELHADPYDPEQNAEAGARLLRRLLIQYQNHPNQLRLALAAYNAGEGAVRKHGGVPPYAETSAYVERVLRIYSGAVAKRRPAGNSSGHPRPE
jgi:soluble lytic murein transglycosylase-like protein